MTDQWFAAAASANPVTIGRLVRLDEDIIDARDSQGRTALHVVAALSRPDAIPAARTLVAAGVPVDSLDNEGHSPLWHAIVYGRERQMVLFLLDVGAATDLCVHPAIDWGDIKILEELIECGADLDETVNGENPLEYARRIESAQVVRVLEEAYNNRS